MLKIVAAQQPLHTRKHSKFLAPLEKLPESTSLPASLESSPKSPFFTRAKLKAFAGQILPSGNLLPALSSPVSLKKYADKEQDVQSSSPEKSPPLHVNSLLAEVDFVNYAHTESLAKVPTIVLSDALDEQEQEILVKPPSLQKVRQLSSFELQSFGDDLGRHTSSGFIDLPKKDASRRSRSFSPSLGATSEQRKVRRSSKHKNSKYDFYLSAKEFAHKSYVANSSALAEAVAVDEDVLKFNAYEAKKLSDEDFSKLLLPRPHLRVLSLTKGASLSDQAYRQIGEICSELVVLELIKCVNLSPASIEQLLLTCAKLKKLNLEGATLNKTILIFIQERLEQLTEIDLTGVRGLNSENLTKMIFSHIKFKNANFVHTDFSESNFWRTDFAAAKLRGANFTEASLVEANLEGVIALETIFLRAQMARVKLAKANLSYADLRYVDLSGADLREADLSYAKLTGANLSQANLSYANLNNADLSSVTLEDTNLYGAAISNVDLNLVDMSKFQQACKHASDNCTNTSLARINLSSAAIEPQVEENVLDTPRVCISFASDAGGAGF